MFKFMRMCFVLIAGLSLSVGTQKPWPYPSAIDSSPNKELPLGAAVVVGGTILALIGANFGFILLETHTIAGTVAIAGCAALQCILCGGCFLNNFTRFGDDDWQARERLLA